MPPESRPSYSGPRPHHTLDDVRARRERIRAEARRAGRRGGGLKALRLANLYALFRDRYAGGPLPDDDAGLDDLLILLHHLGVTDDAATRMRSVARVWAPWLDRAALEKMIAEVTDKPLKWRADTLARRLGVDYQTRQRLELWTIGAIDKPLAQRQAERAERARLAKQKKRRAAGAMPRAEYLAGVASARGNFRQAPGGDPLAQTLPRTRGEIRD